MVSFRITLLGKVQIYDHTQTLVSLPLKAQELLVYLFVHSNQPHDREKLWTQLWPDIPESRSKKYLRQALWQLQNSLNVTSSTQDSIVESDGSWIQLNLNGHIWIDADHFYQVFVQVCDVPGQMLPAEQATCIAEAIRLYRGEFVMGWYHDWCILERERFQSIYLALLDKQIDYCLQQQYFDQGTEYAMQMLRYDKARERTHRRLMRLYYLADNRTAALRQFELCMAALAEELNVQPSKKTLDLYKHIQADDGHDLVSLPTTIVNPLSIKQGPKSASAPLLELIHANVLALQQEVKSLKQALNVDD